MKKVQAANDFQPDTPYNPANGTLLRGVGMHRGAWKIRSSGKVFSTFQEDKYLKSRGKNRVDGFANGRQRALNAISEKMDVCGIENSRAKTRGVTAEKTTQDTFLIKKDGAVVSMEAAVRYVADRVRRKSL